MKNFRTKLVYCQHIGDRAEETRYRNRGPTTKLFRKTQKCTVVSKQNRRTACVKDEDKDSVVNSVLL